MCTLLNRLPRELRDLIYEEVLISNPAVTIQAEQKLERRGSVVRRQGFSTTRPPPLLQTCKQIRGEALKMYYSHNNFTVKVPQDNMKLAIKWLHSVRPRRRLALQHVDIIFTADTIVPQSGAKPCTTVASHFHAEYRLAILHFLDELLALKHVKHGIISFGFEEACPETWQEHFFIHDLQSLRQNVRASGLALGCNWCGTGRLSAEDYTRRFEEFDRLTARRNGRAAVFARDLDGLPISDNIRVFLERTFQLGVEDSG